MALPLANNLDTGQTTGTAISAANSGGGTGNSAFDSVATAPHYSNVEAHSGTLSALFSTTAASRMDWVASIASPTTMYGRAYVYPTSIPTTSFRFIQMDGNVTTDLLRVAYQITTGFLNVNVGGSSSQTSSVALTVNSWNRVEFEGTVNGTTGTMLVKLFVGANADGTTPDQTMTTSSAAATDTSIANVQWGPQSNPTPCTWYMDDVQVNATGFPGPLFQTVTTPAATASATAPVPAIQLQLTPTSATASASSPVPTVAASGSNQTVSPPSGTASAAAPTPAIQLQVAPAAATATASSPTPGIGLAVPAPIGSASASAPIPTVQVKIVVPVATASANSPPPGVNLSVVVPAATASALAPLPALQLKVSPPSATASASAPLPSVQLRISPASATASASAPTPTPKLAVPPAAATANATSPTSSVQLGISPAAASASAAAPVPMVTIGVTTIVTSAYTALVTVGDGAVPAVADGAIATVEWAQAEVAAGYTAPVTPTIAASPATFLGATVLAGSQTQARIIADEVWMGRLFDVEGQFKNFPGYATYTTNTGVANADLTFTAVTAGATGNNISVTYTDPGGTTHTESVAVSGQKITVTLGRAANAIISTGSSVLATCLASGPVTTLVGIALAAGNNGSGVVTALAKTALSNGSLSMSEQKNVIVPQSRNPLVSLNAITIPGSYTYDPNLDAVYAQMWQDILSGCYPYSPYVRVHLEFNDTGAGHYLGINTQYIAWYRQVAGVNYATGLAAYRAANPSDPVAQAQTCIRCWTPTSTWDNTNASYPPNWYPGDDVVDRIGPDSYNRGQHYDSTWLQLSTIAGPLFSWAKTNSRGASPSSTPGVTDSTKKFAICESGCVENLDDNGSGLGKATWMRNARAWIASNASNFDLYLYTDTVGTGSPTPLWVDTTAASQAAWTDLCKQPPFATANKIN